MFTSIKESTEDDWERISEGQGDHLEREYQNVLALLRSLEHIEDGFGVNQLTHACQVASRALRAQAGYEMVVAALCHDMAKPFSLTNHPAVAAEMLKDHLSDDVYQVIRHHGIFLADHTHGTKYSRLFLGEPWYNLAVNLADWDQASFDPSYTTFSLELFTPFLHYVFFGE